TSVPSMRTYSKSGSSQRALKTRSQTPFCAHRQKRVWTVNHLPKASGRSRHKCDIGASCDFPLALSRHDVHSLRRPVGHRRPSDPAGDEAARSDQPEPIATRQRARRDLRRIPSFYEGKSAELTWMRSACSDHSQSLSALQNLCLAISLASPSVGASISRIFWHISACRPLSPSTSFMKLTTKCDIGASCDFCERPSSKLI